MMGFFSLFSAIFMVCLVLLLAWWFSRQLGSRYMKASSDQNIRILEQIRLGTDQRLLLMKMRERVFLIGVSQAGIQMLAELGEDYKGEYEARIGKEQEEENE